MAIETTTSLALHIREFYERTFLENLKKKLVFADFSEQYPVEKGFGPVVRFSRFAVFSENTTPLTEGVPPTEVQLTDERVETTVRQYGDYVRLSDWLLATHLSGYNPLIEKAVKEISYRSALSIDALVRNAMTAASGANVTFAGGRASYATLVGNTDTMTMQDVRKIVRKLKKRDVPFYDGSSYVAFVGPGQAYDLESEQNSENETQSGAWLDVLKYTSSTQIQKGELGKLYSTRFVETNHLSTDSQSGTISEVPFIGRDSVGMCDITEVTKGDRVEMKHINIFIKEPGSAGTADPLNQIATVGYKFNLGAVRLDDKRIEVYKVGETA